MRLFVLLFAFPMLGHTATDPFCTTPSGVPTLPNAVVFVTQMPIAADFATIGSVFANHRSTMRSAGRGGDLYIRYGDGKLCNLTREAGFGSDNFQGANAIAVRDPSPSPDGAKVVFSMVVGAPAQQYQVNAYFWQLYEATGLGQGQAVIITKVPNQPQNFNNVMPVYGSDGRIIFASDRPRNGQAHLYPQHDEYESTTTNTGLWSLNPDNGALRLLQHSPSGSFDPLVDSYGRVVFTRWDHLQRDQQADADSGANTYGTFDYADESATAAKLNQRVEVFPEPRRSRSDLLAGTNLEGHTINHFFPWMINQDGSGEETLNHIGRHELHNYFNRSLNDDSNLDEFIASNSGRVNPNAIVNMLQLREDPLQAGRYLAVEAPEFRTHAAGQIVAISAPPSLSPDQMSIEYITHPDTEQVVADGATPPANHSGHYRNPLPLSNGTLLAAHTSETRRANNDGSRSNPQPRYDFQLKLLGDAGNGYLSAGTGITGGIVKNLSYYDPDVLVSYNGPMWELNPVELRATPTPPLSSEPSLALPEQNVFVDEGVNLSRFRDYLSQRGLALMVARDVTRRDDADVQQPYNLRVPGGISSIADGGKIYDVAHFQFFQGDQVRGIGGVDSPTAGRRVIARHLHHLASVASNPPHGGPQASVAIATDGSIAAFVPAQRAMSWQSLAPDGTPVVRERYWITFQPGEIRVCDGCHGVNEDSQIGGGPAQNEPEALRLLLRHWQNTGIGYVFSDGFETAN